MVGGISWYVSDSQEDARGNDHGIAFLCLPSAVVHGGNLQLLLQIHELVLVEECEAMKGHENES